MVKEARMREVLYQHVLANVPDWQQR